MYVCPISKLTNQNCTTSRTHLVSLTVLTGKPQTVRHTETPGEIKRNVIQIMNRDKVEFHCMQHNNDQRCDVANHKETLTPSVLPMLLTAQ